MCVSDITQISELTSIIELHELCSIYFSDTGNLYSTKWVSRREITSSVLWPSYLHCCVTDFWWLGFYCSLFSGIHTLSISVPHPLKQLNSVLLNHTKHWVYRLDTIKTDFLQQIIFYDHCLRFYCVPVNTRVMSVVGVFNESVVFNETADC